MTYARREHATVLCARTSIILCTLVCAACFDLSEINVIDAGHEGGEGALDAEAGVESPPFAFGADITGMAANAERLFWVEYGTFDALGNYMQNGALKSAPLAGGPTTTHASSLQGPLSVALTTKFAFVMLGRSPRADGTLQGAVVRIALTDGTEERLGVVNGPVGTMATSEDRAFWFRWRHLESIRDDDTDVEQLYTFSDGFQPSGLQVRDARFHFIEWDTDPVRVLRGPVSGGPIETVDIPRAAYIVGADDTYFRLESEGPQGSRQHYLTSVRPGTVPVRIARLQPTREVIWLRFLAIFGNRFVVIESEEQGSGDSHYAYPEGLRVLTGELEPPYALRPLFAGPQWNYSTPAWTERGASGAWMVPTELGVFHTNGARIDFTPW